MHKGIWIYANNLNPFMYKYKYVCSKYKYNNKTNKKSKKYPPSWYNICKLNHVLVVVKLILTL